MTPADTSNTHETVETSAQNRDWDGKKRTARGIEGSNITYRYDCIAILSRTLICGRGEFVVCLLKEKANIFGHFTTLVSPVHGASVNMRLPLFPCSLLSPLSGRRQGQPHPVRRSEGQGGHGGLHPRKRHTPRRSRRINRVVTRFVVWLTSDSVLLWRLVEGWLTSDSILGEDNV